MRTCHRVAVIVAAAIALLGTSGTVLLSGTQEAKCADQEWAQSPPLPCPPDIWSQLSEEQKEAISEMAQAMEEAGEDPHEIHGAIAGKLQELGIEPPAHGFGPHLPPHILDQLTEEEQTEIEATIREMREEGADHHEVHEAVSELLKSYGVEEPEPPEHGFGPHRPPEMHD
jgi:LmbE family N-acetylglucosaminyl deacetylase